MKRLICLLIALLLLFCGCEKEKKPTNNENEPSSNSENNATTAVKFTRTEDGNILSDSGEEYVHLAIEYDLYYFGELEFLGHVEGEEKTTNHMGVSFQTGMYAIKNAENDNILIRYYPNNEWSSIYRKASLPAFEYTLEKCIRLELIHGFKCHDLHTTCGAGITDEAEIAAFLTELQMQESAEEAGLYELVTNSDGSLENCYSDSAIYGFLAGEPNLAVRMEVTSFNDLAYSVTIGAEEYVLPESWRLKLIDTKCNA